MYLLDPSKKYEAGLLIKNDLRRVTGRSLDKKIIIHEKKLTSLGVKQRHSR